MSSATISSKWRKTRILAGSAALSAHIPETRRLDAGKLNEMLDRYGLVYAKPEHGSLGIGVIRVEKRGSAYRIQEGTRIADLASFRQVAKRIASRAGKRSYLAQRGIRVIRHAGRPVDFRVMVQRKSDRSWEVSGMLARVAHPRKAVTNGSQGGSIHDAMQLLAETFGERQADRIRRQFRRLAQLTAARFDSAHPGMNELGLDIAVDGQGRCWILEVNTKPDPKPFKLLRDQSMLRRIVRLGRGYGRVYDLNVTKARRG